jgi:hypothetical protein
VSRDATASMQDDLAMVPSQTCAGLYNDALVASRPKGDIRIRIRPLTRLGERPGSIVPREMDAQRLRNFYDFRLLFPAAYPASIRWQHFTGFLPHQHVNAAHRSPPRSPSRVRGWDCQMVFPLSNPDWLPCACGNRPLNATMLKPADCCRH